MASLVAQAFRNDIVPVYEFATVRPARGFGAFLRRGELPDWAVLGVGSAVFGLAGALCGAWLHI